MNSTDSLILSNRSSIFELPEVSDFFQPKTVLDWLSLRKKVEAASRIVFKMLDL